MAVTASLVKELRELTGAGMLDCKKALEATDGDVKAAQDWLREKGIASAQKKQGRIAAEGLSSVVVDGNRAVVVELNSETDFVAKNEMFLELVKTVGNSIVEQNPADLDAALALEVNGKTLGDSVVDATATIGEKITLRRFTVVEKQDDEQFGSYVHMGGKISALVVVKGGDAELAKDMAMQVASMNPQYTSREDVPQDVIDHERGIQIEIVNNDPSLASKPEKVIAGIIEGRISKSLQDISLLDQIFFKDGSSKVSQILKAANASVVTFVRFAVGEGIEKREENFAEEVAKAAQI
ncbi:elongation factor Ts [Erysipelothrix larvae]|uniref:Elongation factor Ts n=1 Tax=Erysipelothrix larvae TaxID=1514105 RepID=A0A109UGT6_9FIRM|nr:translation elongation factor Ts [Erysipelothrix larvae]AMC93193.1 elongation factor Ts [Erysipelothrix larvae]